MLRLTKYQSTVLLLRRRGVDFEKYKNELVAKLITEEDEQLQRRKAFNVFKKAALCSALAGIAIGVLFTADLILFSIKNLLIVLGFIASFLLLTGTFLWARYLIHRSWRNSGAMFRVTASRNDNLPVGSILFPRSKHNLATISPETVKMLESTIEKAKIISYYGSMEQLENFTRMFPDELYLSDDLFERGTGLRYLMSYLKLMRMAEEEDADIKECFKEHFNSPASKLKSMLTEEHISPDIEKLVDTEYFDTLIAGSYCLGSDKFTDLMKEVSKSDE